MIASVLKRNLCTRRFWLLVIFAAFVMIVGEFDKVKACLMEGAAYTALYIVFRTTLFCQSQAVVAAVMAGVCALGFCEDRENRYELYCGIRTSSFRYASAWAIGNLLTVLAASFFAYLLMFILLCTFMPMTESSFQYENNLAPYGAWVRSFPPLYILIISFSEGCNYAVLALLSMIVLVKYPDKYVAVGVPVILQQLLYWLSLALPSFLSYYHVSIADKLFQRGPVFHLFYTILYFGILYMFFGMQLVRRVEHNHSGERR